MLITAKKKVQRFFAVVVARTLFVSVVACFASPALTVQAQEYTVNLKDTDIQEFIKFVADVMGSTIVIDPSVKGKVKVISSKPVSKAELYDLFL